MTSIETQTENANLSLVGKALRANRRATVKSPILALLYAKPVQLTGNIETDSNLLIDYIIAVYAKHGIHLCKNTTKIVADHYSNEIYIPVCNNSANYFMTHLDYETLATSETLFNLSGNFVNEYRGNYDIDVNLSSIEDIVNSVIEFKYKNA